MGILRATLLRRVTFILLIGYFFNATAQSPEQEDERALLQLYGDEEMIAIATGAKQPIAQAPAVTTVITADDIKNIGATDLDEALETVPGLHVAKYHGNYTSIYTIRGIYSNFNPQALVLVNGIPITNLYQGDRNRIWGGMPVQAIARIEVIRGPGSALYGADAFAGVINIITKTASDIKGTQIGGRAGSFNTQDGWALHGGTWAGFDVAAILEYHNTDGFEATIDADAQSFFDSRNRTRASFAPGSVNLQRQNLDARLDLSRDNWRFRGGLQDRSNFGNGAGVAQALDPTGRAASQRWNADLTYHNPDFTNNWDVTAQISYFDTTQEVQSNITLYPAGARFGNNADFPEGVIGNPEVYERHARSSLSAFYSGFDRHFFRIGAGFNFSSIYDVRETKNYFIPKGSLLPSPLGELRDVTDTDAVFLRKGDRKNMFLFLQDEWNFATDWQLTAGVRYDHYSDFGNTFNPRIALVWEAQQNLTAKLLYGRAFRAPSFAETRIINNPVFLGNLNLNPETINTIELAFDYHPTDKLRLGFNIFNYWWNDIIRFVPDQEANIARNRGQQTGRGLELETEWKALSNLTFTSWYAFQQSTDDSQNHDAGNAPHHQLYVRANWEFLPDWHFTPQAKWIIERERVKGDNRRDIPDYGLVDLTLRRKSIYNHWEIAFSVQNLFDANAREPSPAGFPSAFIPNDLPLAGRNFYGEIRFDF